MKYKLKRIYKRSYAVEKAIAMLLAVLILGAFYMQGFYSGQLYEIRNAEAIEMEMR